MQQTNPQPRVEVGSAQNQINLPFLIHEIQEVLPHRYPFLMLDKIVEFIDGKRIVGVKNVTNNEPFFAGHFPGRPIMPGVMILEALAQLGALFAKLSSGGVARDKLMVFSGAEKVRFRKQVIPGDVLTLMITSHRRKGPFWKVEGSALVDDQVVCEATLMAAEVP